MSRYEEVWHVGLVDDDKDHSDKTKKHLEDRAYVDQPVEVHEFPKLADSAVLLRQHKLHLIIMDVYEDGMPRGIEEVGKWTEKGCAPVILHTSYDEDARDLLAAHSWLRSSTFLQVVRKEFSNFSALDTAMEQILQTRIPVLFLSLLEHVDASLGDHFWRFIAPKWKELAPLMGRPDFIHMVVNRLADKLTRAGISRLIGDVYGAELSGDLPSNYVVPAHCFIIPPVGQDARLGDIRARSRNANGSGGVEYLVVLWPSCDMVTEREGTMVDPKAESVVCAHADELQPQVSGAASADMGIDDQQREGKGFSTKMRTDMRKGKKLWKKMQEEADDRKRQTIWNELSSVRQWLQNTKYPGCHFIPGALWVPNLIIDFNRLEYISLKQLTDPSHFTCVATLASPFAESLGIRFAQFLSRLGVPDIDVGSVLNSLPDER